MIPSGRRSGFSLIEVMLALSVTAIALTAVAQTMRATSITKTSIERQNLLTEYALSLGDRIRALPYGSVADVATTQDRLTALLELNTSVDLGSLSFHGLRNTAPSDGVIHFQIRRDQTDLTRPPVRVGLRSVLLPAVDTGDDYLGHGRLIFDGQVVPGDWDGTDPSKKSSYDQLNNKSYLFRVALTLKSPDDDEPRSYFELLRSYVR